MDFSALQALCTFYDAEIQDEGGKLSKNTRILRKILGRI